MESYKAVVSGTIYVEAAMYGTLSSAQCEVKGRLLDPVRCCGAVTWDSDSDSDSDSKAI